MMKISSFKNFNNIIINKNIRRKELSMTFESPYNLFIISTTLILFKAVLFLNTKASQTKAFNQQVKNNIDKFDRDFRFQLNKEEYEIILRSKKSTSSCGW